MSAALSSPTVRPPLKWAGGKRWLVPYLTPHWMAHQHRRLVEPLCGGLGVAMSLRPRRARLNDVNSHAINLYRWLQRGLKVRIPMRNDSDLYYAHRERFNRLIEEGRDGSREAAQLFYYLNRTGYNGLCRFNKRGLFNVPFGRYDRINYLADFSSYRTALEGWEFTSEDFQSVGVDPDDFVYADPPYDVPFTSYSRQGFSWDDQVRLAEWLTTHPGPVILSNQATPRIRGLYRDLGYRLQFLDAPRRISCTGDRSKAREVLAFRGL